MNLLDMAKGLFDNQMVDQASGFLGESSESTKKGLTAAVPALLAGIINKGSTQAGAADVLRMAGDYSGQDASSLLSGGREGFKQISSKGSGLLSGLFGRPAR